MKSILVNDLPAASPSDRPSRPTTPRRIGVIGLGKMGGGIARNLTRHGAFDVVVYDISPEAVSAVTQLGAVPASGPAAAAADSDLIITSLPMPEDVVRTYSAIIDVLPPDAAVMDTSTIDPTTARRVADLVGEERFVTCLLGKGPAQAEAGSIPLFVGGHDATLDRLALVFDCIGEREHRLGSVEAATAFKLVSNLIGMTNLAVLAEGYALCRQAGVDDVAFAESLADTGAWSYQADVRLPWMFERDFDARFPTSLGLKDLSLAVTMASRWGVPTPVGAAGMSQLANAVAHGHGGDDVASVLAVVDSTPSPAPNPTGAPG